MLVLKAQQTAVRNTTRPGVGWASPLGDTGALCVGQRRNYTHSSATASARCPLRLAPWLRIEPRRTSLIRHHLISLEHSSRLKTALAQQKSGRALLNWCEGAFSCHLKFQLGKEIHRPPVVELDHCHVGLRKKAATLMASVTFFKFGSKDVVPPCGENAL